jgi:hypothetical protein
MLPSFLIYQRTKYAGVSRPVDRIAANANNQQYSLSVPTVSGKMRFIRRMRAQL